MPNPLTVAETPDAPWLPPGSTAYVRAGDALTAPTPAIIVRVLLTGADRQFFCVATEKGLDLPTLFLGPEGERLSLTDGLDLLTTRTVGSPDDTATCIGWVHNQVPHPDGTYPHPIPDAYVPVFRLADREPVVPGEWVTLDEGRPALQARHWWPIVDHHLARGVPGSRAHTGVMDTNAPEPGRRPTTDLQGVDLHTHDDTYEEAPLWSGEPNEVLMTEAARLTPGRAVDVGSGEGADAIWLARQGWQVTGLEPSPAAQTRARAAAESAGANVDWVQATLLDAPLEPGTFDLVSCSFPALLRSADQSAEHALAGLVAPGGVLLLVTHADTHREQALAHGFDPDDYLDHAAVREVLGEGWTIEVDERRPRGASAGRAHHHDDWVLRARRA
ncbi:class I SAM-dependent methyltransferase [Calidifontibacter terrae]